MFVFSLFTACGGLTVDESGSDRTGSGDNPTSDDDAADLIGAVLGAGGGGTLIFDGEEISIESVFCVLADEVIDIGTISETGHRVLIGTNNPLNPIGAQILTPNSLQWFPQNVSGDEAQRDGKTFTSGPTPYFNNNDDRIIEASFEVECP